jgi:hypothetical protein
MSLFSGFELLSVLLVVGILLVLGVRLRVPKNTVMFLVIIAVLFLGLMALSRLVVALFGTVLLLALLVVLLVLILLRRL